MPKKGSQTGTKKKNTSPENYLHWKQRQQVNARLRKNREAAAAAAQAAAQRASAGRVLVFPSASPLPTASRGPGARGSMTGPVRAFSLGGILSSPMPVAAGAPITAVTAEENRSLEHALTGMFKSDEAKAPTMDEELNALAKESVGGRRRKTRRRRTLKKKM